MSKPIYHVGIIGLGYIGTIHAGAYQRIPQTKLIAAADIDAEKRKLFQRNFPEVKVYDNYDTLFDNKQIDIISICTPNYLHYPLIIKALDSKKHIICEKPLAMNEPEVQKIAKAVSKSDVKLMVGFNNRFQPHSQLLQQYIQQGMLGKIYHVETGWLRRPGTSFITGWFGQKKLSGGGPLLDLGVHLLDLSLWFMKFPDIENICAVSYQKFGDILSKKEGLFDVEDFVTALIKFKNQSTISLRVSWACHADKLDFNYINLYGDKGGAQWNPLKIFETRSGVISDFVPYCFSSNDVHYSYIKEINHFLECIENDKTPICSVDNALAIAKLIDGIYLSTKQNSE